MGAAAAVGKNPSEHPVLESIADVRAAHEQDRYRLALKRNEELLARQEHQCRIVGFQSRAQHMRPLMQEKLQCTLSYLDDLASSYSEDQLRHQGRTQAYCETLSMGGPVRALCPLGDGASVACSSSGGPIWVYNWREGREVSRMRTGGDDSSFGGRGFDCAVLRLCTAREDGSLLASGDQRGNMVIWDLHGPRAAAEARLHQGGVTGLCWDRASNTLITASEDTHIMLYDIASHEVVDRAKPASLTCGDGVPSTALEVALAGASKLLLVGGADGKLRCWSKDSAGIRRQSTLHCAFAQPSRVLMARDGWRAVVATCPADPVLCGGNPSRGGLLLYDIRKMSGSDAGSALIAEYRAAPPTAYTGHEAAPPGSIDLTLAGGRGGEIALTCTDGLVRGFDLDLAVGGRLVPTAAEDSAAPQAFGPDWNIDISVGHECGRYPSPYPCAIASVDDSFVATASTSPSLSIWRRTSDSEPWGHSDFVRTPQPKLVLRSCCYPLPLVSSSTGRAQAFASTYGSTLASVQEALERDRRRIAGHVSEATCAA